MPLLLKLQILFLRLICWQNWRFFQQTNQPINPQVYRQFRD